MPQMQIRLGGWQAVLALAAIAGLVAARIVTLQDMSQDADLMRSLEAQVAADYLPGEVARLQAAAGSGDRNAISRAAESVTGTRPKIESVQASAPLLDFSTSREVVVKVVYSLSEGSGTRGRKTVYFLYRHGAVGNSWSYRHKTTALRYYLNFR